MSSPDEESPQAEAETTKVVEMSQAVHEDIQPTRFEPEEPPKPENTETRHNPEPRSPNTKRKASGFPSPESKRPRLSSSSLSHRSPPKTESRQPTSSIPTRAPHLDEKARSRRLFGGILSTIAQKPKPSITSTHRREEAERRAAERAKERAREEQDARRAREIRRRAENAERWGDWERESLMARWGNERYKAQFLRTRSEPSLYYKPYILFALQKETLALQAIETKRIIEIEMKEYEDTHPGQARFLRRSAQSPGLLHDVPQREGNVAEVQGKSVDSGVEDISFRRRSRDGRAQVSGGDKADRDDKGRGDVERDEGVVVQRGDEELGGISNLDGSHDVCPESRKLDMDAERSGKVEEGKKGGRKEGFVRENEGRESHEQWKKSEVTDDDDDEDVIETSEGVSLIY